MDWLDWMGNDTLYIRWPSILPSPQCKPWYLVSMYPASPREARLFSPKQPTRAGLGVYLPISELHTLSRYSTSPPPLSGTVSAHCSLTWWGWEGRDLFFPRLPQVSCLSDVDLDLDTHWWPNSAKTRPHQFKARAFRRLD